MNIQSFFGESFCVSARYRHQVSVAVLTCFLFAGKASAQMVVTDPVVETQTTLTYAQQGLQWAKQVEQYTTQLQQYQQEVQQYEQLLMTVEGLGTNISFSHNQLQPISDTSSLVDQNCPSNSGGSIVSSMVTSIASSISPTQSLAATQQQLCEQITMVQIDEYNNTVDFANQLGNYGNTLQKLNKLANEVNSIGTTSGATTQAATYSATVATAMNNWQSKIAGDEKLIAALNQQQSILARVAMRGQNTPLGNVIQAGALAAWFAAHHYSQSNVIQNNVVQN